MSSRDLHPSQPPHVEGPGIIAPNSAPASADTLITHTPGICGGSARVNGTRIPVWTLEQLRRAGFPESEILLDFPSLTPADLIAAWAYAAEHKAAIDEEIAENRIS